MLRTLLFKTTLFIYFVLWAPLLFIGLVSKRLSRFFVYTDAAGVLVLARLITGIKYQVHYPKPTIPVSQNYQTATFATTENLLSQQNICPSWKSPLYPRLYQTHSLL